MIRSLDHLVLRVADLDAALHFYGEILGMQVRRFGAERVALHCGAQKIELQSLGSESQAQAPQPGSAELCFLIRGELDQQIERLRAAKIDIERGPHAGTGVSGPIRSIHLRDPDGNRIELAEAIHQALPAVPSIAAQIRPATAADATACLEIYAPIVRGSHTSFELEVPSQVEFAARIARSSKSHAWLVAEQDGRILAYAYACPHRERAAYAIAAEVSVYVAPEAHRQGLARALYLDLLTRMQRDGVRLAYAIVTLPNPSSLAFHESLGFRPLALFPAAGRKFDRYWDVAWWVRELA
jgi:L-amino acid N-acyltransferase YncA/catechol 2,3-dioxygenase-like lactoylglutathione lyase family enzyme